VTEESWEMRALSAEALLEEERAEVERLRAYIQELEAKLPDEEGGEDMSPPDAHPHQVSARAIMAREAEGQWAINKYMSNMLEAMAMAELKDPSPQWSEELMRLMKAPQLVAADFGQYRIDPRAKLGPPSRRGERWIEGPLGLKYEVRMYRSAARMEDDFRHTLRTREGREMCYQHSRREINLAREWAGGIARDMVARALPPKDRGRAQEWLARCIHEWAMETMKESER
jgi:hypothetical protein